jgi:tRNA A-37 threonylcarbamoyl transferase component Bud32
LSWQMDDTRKPAAPPARRRSSAARFRWRFAPISQNLCRAIEQIPWGALETCPAASCVKVAGNRDVWRIDLPAGTIYAKCYRSQGIVKQLVDSVRGPAAKREWLALRQAAAIGVLAPTALAYATAGAGRAKGYWAVLITAAMPADAQSLEDAWLSARGQPDPVISRGRKGRLVEALAELIARAHAGGLFHRDLHVGNILIFPHNGSVTAAMVDLHNAHLRKGISLSGVRSNLVQLNQWFARHASRTERLRFLKRYCQRLADLLSAGENAAAGASQPFGHRALARYVLRVSRHYAARLYAKRDRRILRRNKYFATLALPDGWSARIALDIKHGRPYDHRLGELPDKKGWGHILADLPALLAAGGVRPLKSSSRRRVLHVDLEFARVPWPVVAKCERFGSVLEGLRWRLGRVRLQREFVAGWQCLHRELPVALPLAVLTRRCASGGESILLVEYITDSRDLDTFTKLQLPEMPPARALQLKRRICWQLAHTLRRIHGCGLAHRDLKAANIRLQIAQGDPDALKVVLVDVDGIRAPRWRLRRALLRSLARLDASFASAPAVTRSDRLRVLLAVLRGVDGDAGRWKDAWRRIRRMSLRDQAVIARQMPWLQPIIQAAGAE